MGIGASIFLLAIGAILAFAVEVETTGFNLNTIGIILMIAGAIGIVLALTIFGGRDRGTGTTERTVTRERDVM